MSSLRALNLRAKRDPEGAKNWLEGFYRSVVEFKGEKEALHYILTELHPEFPLECFPKMMVRDMWSYIRDH